MATKLKKKSLTKKSSKKSSAKKIKTIAHVAMLVDSSGSMSGIKAAATKAYKKYVSDLRSTEGETGIETFTSVYKFGVDGPQSVVQVHSQLPIEDLLGTLKNFVYTAEGMTPMLDAVGLAIEEFSAIKPKTGERRTFLVVCISDGAENASKKFSSADISRLMKEKVATDLWTFAFLGPRGSRYAFTSQGVPDGNILEWDQTNDGVEAALNAASVGTKSYMGGVSRGITKSTSFFSDASKISASKAKKVLDKLNGEFYIWPVKAECEIKDLVEQHGYQYEKGKGFYQLTKDEKAIQDYKQIVLRDKKTGDIYGGDDSRGLLGFPSQGSVKVKPGNHGNWDIFVQSTSTNRKLVRGTHLLYAKN